MKDKEKDDNKKLKKWIVNLLTGTRVVGTVTLPFLFNALSAPIFILVVASILATDILDGFLARKWDVSTIFGSFLDMGADKLFGFAVIATLSTMYPFMRVLLLLEILIPLINSESASYGAAAKSSQIGRIKTVILGVSMCSLFITGMSPEIIKSLENIKTYDFTPYMNKFEAYRSGLINTLIEATKVMMNKIIENKNVIETIAKTTALTSEAIVVGDYAIKGIKQKDKSNEKYKMIDYLTKKEYLNYMKKVLFDEKYYKETINMSMYEKLTPPELRKNKVKKLTLDKN